jgi:hypothetical protein
MLTVSPHTEGKQIKLIIRAMNADESGVKRFLCSDLAILSVDGQARYVSLEEIWRTGAVVEAEESAPLSASGELRSCGITLNADVERVEQHDYGYRIELRFRDREWTPELFKPAHLTDLTAIGAKARAQGAEES